MTTVAWRGLCKLVVALAIFGALCPSNALARMGRGGTAVSSSSGFLPAEHWVVSPVSSTMVPIFPLGDNVTSATARVHQAYWDGTNDIPYDVAIGDEFGAYPYVCTMVQGPPGMTVEQSTYTTFQNPAYCRVIWHPQGNISSAWNGEVEVAVTDQQHNTIDMSWALWTVGQYSTSSFSASYSVNGSSTLTISGTCTGSLIPGTVLTGTDIPAGTYVAFDLTGSGCDGTYALSTAASGSTSGTVSGSYQGGAVFASATGSGSTCTYAAPCLLSAAFGSTYATTANPGAIVYAFGGSYSGSSNLPAYTDSGAISFKTNSSTKPNALIGIPGQTVTLDASAAQYFMSIAGANDWYMENVTANGFLNNASLCDHLIELSSNRLTFDQVNWTNSGYGCTTGSNPQSGNMSMFGSGGGTPVKDHVFFTDSSESNRQSGSGGNNFGFEDLYSYSYVLTQRSTENSPSATMDSVFYMKSDVTWSELREDVANVSSAISAFSFGQSQYSGMGNDESDYNLGVNTLQIAFGKAGNELYTYQPFAVVRNTLITGTHQPVWAPTTYNLEGPGSGYPGGIGVINMTSTTGGSLTAGTQYTCGATSLGVTGESAPIIGSNGDGNSGVTAGDGNENTLTLAAGDNAILLSWLPEPGATGYNVYCEVAGSGTWTEYAAGTATSFTYTGAVGTSASPPANPGNAVSAARFDLFSNAMSTTYSPALLSGATIVTTQTGVANNAVDSSGTGSMICTAVGTGCAAIGDLNTTYSGYSALIGTAGYQIQ